MATPPTSPPTVTGLPSPAPSRQEPSTFRSRMDATLGALTTYSSEQDALSTWENLTASQVYVNALEAATSRDAAVAAANYQGDYDAGTTYTLGQSVSNDGKIWAAKRTVTGVTPVEGADWFQVTLDLVVQPTNVSPANAATDLGSGPTLTGSEYGSLYGLTQAASQWQVSTAADFSTTVVDTGDVAGVGVTYTVPSGTLSVSTTYYWRCRYKDPDGVYSDWSDGTSFTTAASFYPSSEVAKIVASDAEADDEFGRSVAISGSYAIVGAYGEDTGGTDAGAAYIFERDGSGTWSQVQKLQASDAAANDDFGWSVAIDGNYAIVSSPGEDSAASGAGAAYIFERDGSGTWSQVQKITASDAASGDDFGESVAIDGNYAIVSTISKDNGAVLGAGAAYIFERDGSGTWSQEAKIVSSDLEQYDRFGSSVSISGDYVIVGAYAEDTTASSAGAAYFFERSGDTWPQVQKIQASDAEATDRFGWSVAIDGSYAIVGSYLEDTGGSAAGAAYIFERDGSGTWSQVQKIQANTPVAAAYFGASVDISGDYALISAWRETTDTGGTDAGAAYIFERDGSGTWSQGQKYEASDAEANDQFGFSVAVSDSAFLFGSNLEDAGGSSAGAVYIFE